VEKDGISIRISEALKRSRNWKGSDFEKRKKTLLTGGGKKKGGHS